MDLRRRGLLLIAKMALQDGVVAAEERRALEDMSGGMSGAEIDAMIDEARRRSLDDLLGAVEKYEDRFVIALRVYHMAHSDRRYDIAEEMNFDLLATRFGITEADKALIARVQGAMDGDAPAVPEPRLMTLHRGSSFFDGDH